MNSSRHAWVLQQLDKGKPIRSFALAEGASTIGRSPTNTLHLQDKSVSRSHARIQIAGNEVTIEDLGSTNGILINGLVKRQRTPLQPEDKLQIGDLLLHLVHNATAVQPSSPPPEPSSGSDDSGVTIDPLPTPTKIQKSSEELSALIQACSLLAEGLDTNNALEPCLALLLRAFRADEVHWYPTSGEREEAVRVTPAGGQPSLRLFPFLLGKFRQCTSGTIVLGRDIGRHQQGISEYNYLVGPVVTPQGNDPAKPLLVLARNSSLVDFEPTDRSLLDLICQVWANGLGRSKHITVLQTRAGIPELLGNSKPMEDLRSWATKVAASKSTVFIWGENGSGKEVISHFIHEHSPRRDKPFIQVNIAAIPENMIESELFGHVRGAFTGAVKARKGKFAAADGGTILLDEIGDLPLSLQAKLLRTIESGEVQPLGAETVSRVDARVIVATNRDLNDMVEKNLFRRDLYHRLDRLRVVIPPLREHLEDIDLLASRYLQRLCAENEYADLQFSPDSFAALKTHRWPGNVRELYAVVERCALAVSGSTITPDIVAHSIRR